MRELVDQASIRAASLALFADRGYRATTMADIGAALGIRGPSLYKHVPSKQSLLVHIMIGTMEDLLRAQRLVLGLGGDAPTRLRRMVEAHVRYHAAHRREAFVGNREIGCLDKANRQRVLTLRADYESRFRAVIEEGQSSGVFDVRSPRLSSYAIVDMGIGVAVWFRPDGEQSVDEVAYVYADLALRMVAAGVQASGTEAPPST
jgi:AcrR family transcriptional regulator